MYDEWVAALKEAAEDKSVVVTVVTGDSHPKNSNKCSYSQKFKCVLIFQKIKMCAIF
jgi:hypothetical protein